MLGIYHTGELAVQARAGVQEMAQRVEGAIKTMRRWSRSWLYNRK